MGSPRLIPVVTLLGIEAVKTRQFRNPKYVGDPVNTVTLLSSFEVEELIVLDISSSFGRKKVPIEILRQIVNNAFMPIAFGGGITSFEYAKAIFEIGFDKVVIRSKLFDDNLVRRISQSYGSQAVSGCLDVFYPPRNPKVMIVNGQEFMIEEIARVIEKVKELSIGELFIHDIEHDGSRVGLREHPLLSEAIKSLDIPIVPMGGCANTKDAAKFLLENKCHSIAASTMFLFRPTRDAILVSYPHIDQWHELLGVKSD